MTKLSKLFLLASVVTFAFSLTEVGGSLAWGLIKPTGIIFFILFFISHLVESVTAQHEAECGLEQNHASAPEVRASQSVDRPSKLTAAHSH